MSAPEEPSKPRVHLVLLGPHTRVVATLCAACPSGPAGCCAAPPGLSWADIGRIESLGGGAWLIAEIRAGRLRRGPRGLIIDRMEMEGGGRKCIYHGPEGCTVSPDRRSAACNYYICGDALEDGGPDVVAAEAACLSWTAQYAAWDEVLSAEVGGWGERGEDDEAPLFEQLGRRYLVLCKLPTR